MSLLMPKTTPYGTAYCSSFERFGKMDAWSLLNFQGSVNPDFAVDRAGVAQGTARRAWVYGRER
jgi:hypothetical protein